MLSCCIFDAVYLCNWPSLADVFLGELFGFQHLILLEVYQFRLKVLCV